MKLVYMVQTEADLPEVFYPLLHMPDVTVLHLSFRKQVPGALYLPDSTWTEGRNALLAAARAMGQDFEYYVFCDDDLEFERGSFSVFNAQLAETRPAIGIPLYDFAPNHHDDLESHTVYAFDAFWAEVEAFLFEKMYNDRPYLEARFRHHYHKAQEVPRAPSPPASSYRLTSEQRDKLNLDGPFWAGRNEAAI